MTKKILFGLITYCLLLTAFSVLPQTAHAQDKKALKKARKLTDDGNKQFGKKNYKGAIDQYAQAIVLAPNLPEPHFWKGYAHYYLKEYEPSLTEINRAEDLGFKNLIEIYKIRWFLYYENKNYDEALEDVDKGLAAEPNNLTLLVASGDLNRAKENYREAITAYRRALQMKINNSGDINYFVALSHSKLGETKEQGEFAAAAIQNGTKFIGESYALAGDAFQKQRDFPQAVESYLRSLTAKDGNYTVYRSLADIYRNQNEFDQAIEISKKALILFPNDGDIYTDLSWYYSQANRNEDAIQAGIAGTRLVPNKSLAFTNLCRAYNDKREYQLAINSCSKALQMSPNDGETNFYLGFAYQASGKTNEAPKYYKKAITGLYDYTQSNPYYSDGFYLLGNAYISDNQPQKAIDAYLKCLELSPRYSRARYNLGVIYVTRSEKNSALEQYNALLNLDKDLAGKLKTSIDKM